MKFKIFKSKKKANKKREEKIGLELILFVFSMCAITILLIFGTIEDKKLSIKGNETVPVFSENKVYQIFDLNLLKNTKTPDRVSDFGKNEWHNW